MTFLKRAVRVGPKPHYPSYIMHTVVNILFAAAVLHIISVLGLWGIFVKNVIPSKGPTVPMKTTRYIETPY